MLPCVGAVLATGITVVALQSLEAEDATATDGIEQGSGTEIHYVRRFLPVTICSRVI